MTREYVLRTARQNDKRDIFDLYRRVMCPYIDEIWGWDSAWQHRDFAACFAPDNIALAGYGEQLVGYCQVERRQHELFVRMLAVLPEHQRKGLGSRLLETVCKAQGGLRDTRLQVFKINVDAQRFYARLGFRLEGETPHSLIMVRTNA